MTDTAAEQHGGNVSKVRGQKTRELFLEGLAAACTNLATAVHWPVDGQTEGV